MCSIYVIRCSCRKSSVRCSRAAERGTTRHLKEIEDLTFTDDFMFKRVMLHPRICRRVVERILGRPIGKIRILEAEKTAKEAYLAKGIRMDVYIKDDHTHYDIEMQTTQQAAISKRARYHQSAMDMESLHPNETYPDRKDGCVIFICQTTHLAEILHAIQGRRGVWKRPISCRMMVRRRSFCTPLGIPVANPRRWSGFSSTCRILPTPQGIPCWRISARLCSMRSRVHGRRGLTVCTHFGTATRMGRRSKGPCKG